MASLVSYCKSLPLQFKIFSFDLLEYVQVVFNYYSNFSFAKADLSLVLKGWMDNPFRIARLYVEKEGGDPDFLSSYTYGETPLTTFAEIARVAGLSANSTFIECGAGRGRLSLFAYYLLGCRVIAYELVPEFVNRLKRLPFIQVQEKSYLEGDFSAADAIYLYGTTLSEEEIVLFGKQLEKAKPGTTLITVSWYLNEVPGTPHFPVLKILEGTFPWGKTNIYIQVKHP
jgi:hypothetical protein